MPTLASDVRHLRENDYVEVQFENSQTGSETLIRGVVDEKSLDDEWPHIELAVGGSHGLRITWGENGGTPFAVTRLSFQETRIGTGEQIRKISSSVS